MTAAPQPLAVVAAAIVRGPFCLVAQRQFTDSLPGRWEFPGGKIERGESPEQALHREILEELGTTIRLERYLGRGTARAGKRIILLDVYLAGLTGPEPQALEHRAVRWVDQHELLQMKLAEADLFALTGVIDKMKAAPSDPADSLQ